MSILGIGSSKVKKPHGSSPKAVEDGYSFKFTCKRSGRKYTVEGVIQSDSKSHAKERTTAIYKALEKTFEDYKKPSDARITLAVTDQLHKQDEKRLKKISITFKEV